MNTPYPRGSEWRRWDIHVHTPKSIVQEFGGDTKDAWDAFIKKIASLPPEIKVIGVTDYLFCDGYEHLLTRKSEIPNIELIIPNIEFRLNTFSGTSNNIKRHNFHVLFDPSISVADIRGQLLNCLSSGYKIQDGSEWQQTPNEDSLKELGREMKASAPAGNGIHSRTDLQAGFDNITYKREDIEKLLQKNCFKGKFVTAMGYAEWDQSRWDQSAAEKRDLINSANFCLTCCDDPAKIAENRDDLIKNKLNSVILHSSDAHKLDQMGNTLLWIKADPTFAGLKQVLNEPQMRVFIGTTPPNYKPDHKVIKKISIPSSNGWFREGFGMELNRDLVTIIGGRGSGKSALAEAIAYGAGNKDNTDNAFLHKAGKHKNPITGVEIIVEWEEGEPTKFKVGDLEEDQGLVLYLPQGVVEELCSPKNNEILQKQIENVIFQALDETESMGASDFEELRSQILMGFQYEKEQQLEKIRETNRKLYNLERVLRDLPGKRKLLLGKKIELIQLTKSLPVLPAEDKKSQEELSVLAELKRKFEAKIIELQGKVNKLVEVEAKVKVFRSRIKDFKGEIDALLINISISDAKAFDVHLDEARIKAVINETKAGLAEQLKVLREGKKQDVATILSIPVVDLQFDNFQSLNKGIEDKQKETRAFETTKLKYQQQKKSASDLEGSIKSLESEIAKINSHSAADKLQEEKERLESYCSYFELLKSEKVEIEKLYLPLQASLSAGTDTDKKLIFEAQINYRLTSHYESGLSIIDRTRKGSFRDIESLKNALTELWDDFVREDFKSSVLESNLNKIFQHFTTFDGADISIEEQLRESFTTEDFYNWLFDPSYFGIISSLKFEGTDLYLLSPGQKGIILLMLYLEIDKADYRPLIIDQPEENLDSLSVYKDLINYFKERKQYRQIIMVTHNANLVVNTDADQVIVANYEGARSPRLEYCCGSLEDQARKIPELEVDQFENGIIEEVCNILEGGESAFSKRKRKYQISTRSQI